ncbi:unnamed protein product [Acanthoscelides obtectus]|uniref:Uncharacterized protein n=1 Tax=Acanthoscelides obtectus TaxID=200917 RepID=A0A9P0LZF7_ACAOB|nr:unnamed protein product [Acanthoscelides obtectus]CAK1629434.1 hypothetical protein AOBTE_LOCUS5744 [Acanthoscelides obtectus]
MPDIDDYSEAALERTVGNIKNYRRTQDNGVIEITYDFVERLPAAGLGVGVGGLTGLTACAVIAAAPVAGPALLILGTFYGAMAAGGAVGAVVGITQSRRRIFDIKTGELLGTCRNDASDKLNDIGHKAFQEGRYAQAFEYFRNAYYNCSSGYRLEQTFKKNTDLAETKVAIENLKLQADSLLSQSKYSEAHSKYQEAYDKSQVESEKHKYRDHIISVLDALWDSAWMAENDDDVDRSEEAEMKFQILLDICNKSRERHTDIPQFNRYQNIISLKIDGNTLFNSGIDLQLEGVTLLRSALGYQQQQQYQLANTTFSQARMKFSRAMAKFEEGKTYDERFASCASFVQEKIDEVDRSIESIRQMRNQGLQNLTVDIGNYNHSEPNSETSSTDNYNLTQLL